MSNNNRSDGKTRPVEEVRLGVIQAAIWRNETEKGSMFNATFERSYKERETEEWRTTHSFGRDDLPVIEKVAAKAYARIHALQDAERKKAREQEREEGVLPGDEPSVASSNDPEPTASDAPRAARAKAKRTASR